MQHATGVCEKKRPLRKFDAKASFDVWSTASDVVFREESEVGVENSPPKKNIFLVLKKIVFFAQARAARKNQFSLSRLVY
mgnify:CR=1 FL=1